MSAAVGRRAGTAIGDGEVFSPLGAVPFSMRSRRPPAVPFPARSRSPRRRTGCGHVPAPEPVRLGKLQLNRSFRGGPLGTVPVGVAGGSRPASAYRVTSTTRARLPPTRAASATTPLGSSSMITRSTSPGCAYGTKSLLAPTFVASMRMITL